MNPASLVLAAITCILLIIGLLLFVPIPRSGVRRQTGGTIDRDDDRYWLGGMIYNNPDDPELIVPKRYVPGRTLNVGHPVGRLITIGMVLFIVLMTLLLSSGAIHTVGCHPSGCSF